MAEKPRNLAYSTEQTMVNEGSPLVYSTERAEASEGSPLDDPYGSKSQTSSEKTQSLCGQCA